MIVLDRHEDHRLRLDDPVVFRAYYDRLFPQVAGYFQRRCRDLRDADDLTQDTFLAAVRRIRAGEDVDDPRAWTFGIARHLLVDHYRHQDAGRRAVARHRVRSREALDEWAGEDPPEQVAAALAALPALQRSVLVLHHVDDLPIEEVARLVGRSPKAVESLLVRARAALRTRLEGVSQHVA
jgi:RNA polymerase sigma-70 factor, ECF subfamily